MKENKKVQTLYTFLSTWRLLFSVLVKKGFGYLCISRGSKPSDEKHPVVFQEPRDIPPSPGIPLYSRVCRMRHGLGVRWIFKTKKASLSRLPIPHLEEVDFLPIFSPLPNESTANETTDTDFVSSRTLSLFYPISQSTLYTFHFILKINQRWCLSMRQSSHNIKLFVNSVKTFSNPLSCTRILSHLTVFISFLLFFFNFQPLALNAPKLSRAEIRVSLPYNKHAKCLSTVRIISVQHWMEDEKDRSVKEKERGRERKKLVPLEIFRPSDIPLDYPPVLSNFLSLFTLVYRF